ncbi:ATP-binding protein [Streptomyces sp. NPDC049881]|uniref:ATP-binding protein n=1 Tax=Streptomyces sp. NPDC049881 TaxID=3155778 RepID=UPI003441F681
MSDADTSGSTTDGPLTTHRIDIGGSTTGPVVAGDHNVVVDAQHGSRVTVVMGPERPRPRRRQQVALLPRSITRPVGRENETRTLAAAVRAGGPAQLWGPPGIGKTTLLRHAALVLPPGPDGVVFLGGAHRDIGDLAQELFEACYEAPGYAPTRTELRRLMTDVRVTVYVDDVALSSDQLLELMDAAPGATFVVAGAERSLWGDGTALQLGGLTPAAGLELLARELGGALPEGEREVADALCRVASGRPLPLLRAAAVAVESASAGGGRLPRPGEVAALLPMLLDHLASDAAVMRVLHLLATLDGAEVAPAHVGALVEEAEPEAVCDRLVRLGLAGAGQYGYRAVADTLPELRRRFPAPFSAERLCDHFIRWGALGTTTPVELAVHGGVLEKVAELAESARRPELAVRLARATTPGLARSLRFGAWGRLIGRGWQASRAAGDRRAEAYFLHEEAVRALLIGRRAAYTALLAQSAWLGYELGAEDGGNTAATGDDSGTGHLEGPGGEAGADTGPGRSDFDVDRYMGDNGFGPAAPSAPDGHGFAAQPSGPVGGEGLRGGATGDGGTADGADFFPLQSNSAVGDSWGGGANAPSSGTAAGAEAGAGAGVNAAAAAIVSLIVGCALFVGLGYAISAATGDDEKTPSEVAQDDAVPIPTFTFSLPDEPTDTPTESAPTSPPGCDQRGDAHSAFSEAMSEAPLTNPGHDQAWAGATHQLADDLAAAARAATDPAIQAAIQEESSDQAALATAITNDDAAAVSTYNQEVYDDGGVVIDLCYG